MTHGIGFLPKTDLIIVIANCTVSETGSYQQLLQNKGVFADFLRVYLTEEADVLDLEDPEAAAIKQELLEEIGASPPTVANGALARSGKSNALPFLNGSKLNDSSIFIRINSS